MTTQTHHSALLVPRARPERPTDFATRGGLIARQGHRARRLRHARRAIRVLGRVLIPGLALTALGIAGVAVAHWLRTTPYLAVASVEVTGTRRLDDAEVLRAAGIQPGAGILALDWAAIQGRVEALPGIRHARVVRHLPTRVVLMVEEREPYALVNPTEAEGLVWIDAEGHLIGPERRASPPALPILSGVEPPAARAGAPVADRLRLGLTLLRALERTGGQLAGRISEIDLALAEGPVLYTVDGIEVRLGREAWEARLARLDGVLGELDTRGEAVESVDLRFRDLVVLRPSGGPDATASTLERD